MKLSEDGPVEEPLGQVLDEALQRPNVEPVLPTQRCGVSVEETPQGAGKVLCRPLRHEVEGLGQMAAQGGPMAREAAGLVPAQVGGRGPEGSVEPRPEASHLFRWVEERSKMGYDQALK